MPEEIGMCGALMMEAMLMRGNEAHARTIAGEIVHQLRGTRVSLQAQKAIAFATETIDAHGDAVAAVRHVHQYFEALLTDPGHEFTAL